MTSRFIQGVRVSSLLVAALALTIFLAVSHQAVGKRASLSVSLKPRSPAAGSSYTLTIKGTARKGKLGKHRNRSELDRVEQLGGTCEATPQAELRKSGIIDLGPVFLKKGPFKIIQKRRATKGSHTTIRFCVYLSSRLHRLNGTATAAYTTP